MILTQGEKYYREIQALHKLSLDFMYIFRMLKRLQHL